MRIRVRNKSRVKRTALLLACALYVFVQTSAMTTTAAATAKCMKFSVSSLTWVNPCSFAPVAVVRAWEHVKCLWHQSTAAAAIAAAALALQFFQSCAKCYPPSPPQPPPQN
uniref:Uncharacterized protein n=1 Tax=Sipha flava TaxID=143950 RepID=A0A2S2QBV3_9HEMI